MRTIICPGSRRLAAATAALALLAASVPAIAQEGSTRTGPGTQAGFELSQPMQGCKVENGLLVNTGPTSITGYVMGTSLIRDVKGDECTSVSTQYGTTVVWGSVVRMY